jgi:spore coat polysaccharide biosynthesis protein SpsF
MTRAVIIQARLASTRFPRKVLADICGHSMLERVVDRCRQSHRAEVVIVATPPEPELHTYCLAHGFSTFMGAAENVLQRYLECAHAYAVDVIARVTADCPLIDPAIIDCALSIQAASGAAYVDTLQAFPEGMDVEVFTTEALAQLALQAPNAQSTEHIGVGFRALMDCFASCRLYADPYRPPPHWSVDTPEDLDHLRWLVPRLPANFTWRDVLELEELRREWQA